MHARHPSPTLPAQAPELQGLLWGLARPRPATKQPRKKLQKAGSRSLTNRSRSSPPPAQIPAVYRPSPPRAPPSDVLRDSLRLPTLSQHVCDTITNRCGRHRGRRRSHGGCCRYAFSLPLAPAHAPPSAAALAGVPDDIAHPLALTLTVPPPSYFRMADILPLPAAYAAYFDYRRRNSPEFRKQLRRSQRQQARAEKDQANASATAQRQAIKDAVDGAKEEGFPASAEEKEAYFLEQVQAGEVLSSDRTYPTNRSGAGGPGEPCRYQSSGRTPANMTTRPSSLQDHRLRPRLLQGPQGLPHPERPDQHLRQHSTQGEHINKPPSLTTPPSSDPSCQQHSLTRPPRTARPGRPRRDDRIRPDPPHRGQPRHPRRRRHGRTDARDGRRPQRRP